MLPHRYLAVDDDAFVALALRDNALAIYRQFESKQRTSFVFSQRNFGLRTFNVFFLFFRNVTTEFVKIRSVQVDVRLVNKQRQLV